MCNAKQGKDLKVPIYYLIAALFGTSIAFHAL